MDMFEEAYRQLINFTKRYERLRKNARGARRLTARLAMALLRAGLPMPACTLFTLERLELGRLAGRGYSLRLRRPGGVSHGFFVTEKEVREIVELARQLRELYVSDESLVRSLEYELRRFRETYGLNITPLDVYALKLWCCGLMDKLSIKYSARRLRMTAEHILSRAALSEVVRW